MLSKIKDKEHIKQDFHSVAHAMPQGWDMGVLVGGGGGGGAKCYFPEHDHVAYQIEEDAE